MKILKRETKKKFGYSVSSLKPNSEKIVICVCGKCKSVLERKFNAAKKRKYCAKCSNKMNANKDLDKRAKKMLMWHSKNVHPLQGIPRPPHVLEALRNADKSYTKTPEYRKKMSENTTGEKNGMYGKKHTPQALRKMKKFQRINPRRGKESNFYGRTYHTGKGNNWHLYVRKDKSEIWMHSSWETKFAKYLDDNNIEWIYEHIRFPITYKKKEGTYAPDFFIVKENYYIELKGWWRDDGLIKYRAFKRQYPDIEIKLYREKELKKLGIL